MNQPHRPVYPEFSGKCVLITGGTQGVGKAAAARLGAQGASLYLNYAHDDEAAAATLREFRNLGYPTQLCKGNLAHPAEIDVILENICAAQPLDILILNAAYQQKVGFFQTDLKLINDTFAINVTGNFHLLQQASKRMIAAGRPGRVVICTSPHGTYVYTGTFAYDVSKAALNHLMRCAALELIAHNIRVNAVDIGWTHTPGERKWFTEEQQNELAKTIPIGRPADADEMAAVIEFLLSDQASYVVGSLYLADGGFCLKPNPDT